VKKLTSLLTRLGSLGGYVLGTVYSILPTPGITRPIFIIGCGRSGTTILGTALSKHRHVTYLNEPRHLWFSAYPETDIWTRKAHSRNGKLVLTAADVDCRKSEKLGRHFRFATIISRKPVLIEKLPINNFRLRFIHQIFPDARFIHIYRNGLEVARSIEKQSEKGRWFGADSYKWDRLVEYALSRDDTNRLPELCSSYFDRGLLEWRLSTEAAVEFLHHLADDVFFELKYDELIDDPVNTISRTIEFIGIDDDSSVKAFASNNIFRRTSKLGQCEVSKKEQILGGRLLPLSMDEVNGLTKRSPETRIREESQFGDSSRFF
jgi:hypothetical protein